MFLLQILFFDQKISQKKTELNSEKISLNFLHQPLNVKNSNLCSQL